MTEPAGSFRAYLDRLDRAGELVRVEEGVSWDLEAGAITTLANERDAGIPLFESVSDAETDARLVGDPYRGSQHRPWDRVGTALGVDPDRSGGAFYDAVLDRLRDPVEPVEVAAEEAPCKEVVDTDPELLGLPWPYIHAGDGGRYATLHTLVAPDPDSGWVDWSTHRAMLHDDSGAGLLLLAGEQTPNLYYYKYERRNEPMPVALSVGARPAAEFAASMWIPTGSDEARYAGALAGEPVELVACETSDLRVPAGAEVVVEGRVLPGERLDEGPFGDYFGYMNGPRRSMPALEVDAITHRERPLIPFCAEGTGVGYSENTTSSVEMGCVGPDATLGLRAAGFDVQQCVPWRYTPRTAYVVATGESDPGTLHELANFIFTTWGMLHIDFFVFVDPEVDPFDTRAVLEAVALNADPTTDFRQFGAETMPKVPLNIYQTPTEKGDVRTGTSKAKTAKAYIDATGSREGPLGPADRDRARAVLGRAGVDVAAGTGPGGGDRR